MRLYGAHIAHEAIDHLPLRRAVLCPAELLAHMQFLFVSVTPAVENPPNVRRRPLYPTELRGHIQKIFNFTGLQDSNDSIFRRAVLYPAELLARALVWQTGPLIHRRQERVDLGRKVPSPAWQASPWLGFCRSKTPVLTVYQFFALLARAVSRKARLFPWVRKAHR